MANVTSVIRMSSRPVAETEQEHVSVRTRVLMFLNGDMKPTKLAGVIDRDYRTVRSKLLPQFAGKWRPRDIEMLSEYFDVSEDWLRGKLPFEPIVERELPEIDEADLGAPITEETQLIEHRGEEAASRASAVNDEGPAPRDEETGPSDLVAGAGFEPTTSGL